MGTKEPTDPAATGGLRQPGWDPSKYVEDGALRLTRHHEIIGNAKESSCL